MKEFVERTNAISLQAKAGRYGGTYAHKDIAFEFAMWISPEFKVYIGPAYFTHLYIYYNVPLLCSPPFPALLPSVGRTIPFVFPP